MDIVILDGPLDILRPSPQRGLFALGVHQETRHRSSEESGLLGRGEESLGEQMYPITWWWLSRGVRVGVLSKSDERWTVVDGGHEDVEPRLDLQGLKGCHVIIKWLWASLAGSSSGYTFQYRSCLMDIANRSHGGVDHVHEDGVKLEDQYGWMGRWMDSSAHKGWRDDSKEEVPDSNTKYTTPIHLICMYEVQLMDSPTKGRERRGWWEDIELLQIVS